MTEGTLASAVALPDQDPIPSPEAGLKRRQSSITEPDSEYKRRRLSSQTEINDAQTGAERKLSSPDVRPRRPAGGRDEERKRGQRLFGALLGTLSQSSTSAAQKRRADIERRQQDKLKLQDEEYGELKKKRREERAVIRKKEQRLYEEESMRTRHSNLVAMAHFLKTRTEPVLYYKPWQLRAEEEDIIQDQIKDAEATVAREVAEFETEYAPHEEMNLEVGKQDTQEEIQEQAAVSESDALENKSVAQASSVTMGAETTVDGGSEEAKPETTPAHESNVSMDHDRSDIHRHDDDGGEVVEDQEDTVIY
ncbi:hypothetical protein BO94DRAFT_65569 [Aspergillus sclerotioniger CBS 115572]|uniref:Pinin/SDK/MemA protein domain-containing protein n=1 Tax=Aspergillus sclerotioniger CBS 115572 TaxID=1450535 RepID=A0A317WKL9_9EURO|nr:hypothetical protein BO94DRAFT_65569 [Aspergillus sclerotioniger CBS 115572]PWY87036.1 hypothetical protein BO94DRAFT_65569 [Aspergillus sclerotioniger CBS 115572]